MTYSTNAGSIRGWGHPMRADVEPGWSVKLIFHEDGQDGAERMWVMVTEARGDQITGILGNQPIDMMSVAHGDRVTFMRDDIIDVIEPDED